MTHKSEYDDHAKVAAILKDAGVWYQRIESPETGNGIADFDACQDGRSIRLEVKRVRNRDHRKSGISNLLGPGQWAFLVRHAQAGGLSFVVLSFADRVPAHLGRPILLWALEVNDETKSALDSPIWSLELLAKARPLDSVFPSK